MTKKTRKVLSDEAYLKKRTKDINEALRQSAIWATMLLAALTVGGLLFRGNPERFLGPMVFCFAVTIIALVALNKLD